MTFTDNTVLHSSRHLDSSFQDSGTANPEKEVADFWKTKIHRFRSALIVNFDYGRFDDLMSRLVDWDR